MSVTIYHNPACGTSRNTLAMIRNAQIEPRIIEYLKTPPSRGELADLVNRMGISLRSLMRRKGTPFDELGLDDPFLNDDALYKAIDRYPILINRPIVVTPRGVKLCRPSETVLELLDAQQQTAFVKEDGEPIVIAVPLAPGEFLELQALLLAAQLPAADVAQPGRQFYSFRNTLNEIVGYGGLEGDGDERLLRSVAVIKTSRGKRVGEVIVKTLERLAADGGTKRLHLLTIDAAPFFKRLGYTSADRRNAPIEILETAEFSALCPLSAHYLVKVI